MSKKIVKYNLLYSFLLILLVAFDRITKNLAIVNLKEKSDIELIPNVLSLHYLENAGAAWGVMQNKIVVFLIITLIVIAILFYLYVKTPFTKRYIYYRFTLILLMAGAVGNCIDRILWKYVVDFIYVKAINFPVFNVADCYVCIGVVLLAHCYLFYYKKDNLI